MDISIIIVSWNVRDYLKKCLNSIYKNQGNLSLEIIVVDNNSKDQTSKMVIKEFPQVQLITNKKNLGFAKANNQAIKQANGDFILLLNPDTEILPNTLVESVKFMKNHSSAGVMGCQLLNSDKSIQPSVRHFPTIWPIFLMLIKLPKIFPNLKSINHYLNTDFNYDETQTVDQVMGAFMMIKKEIFKKIGLLDERFFVWFEEVDFCRRVWQQKYKVYYFPEAKTIHYGGSSFNQQKTIKKQWRFFRSAFYYFKKNL